MQDDEGIKQLIIPCRIKVSCPQYLGGNAISSYFRWILLSFPIPWR